MMTARLAARNLVKLARELISSNVERVELKPARNSKNTTVIVTFSSDELFGVRTVIVTVSPRGAVKLDGKRSSVRVPSRYMNMPPSMFDMAIYNWLSQDRTWEELGKDF